MLKSSFIRLSRKYNRMPTLPVVDLDCYRASSSGVLSEVSKLTKAFKTHSAVIVKDSRYSPNTNDEFLDVMEIYFKKRRKQYLEGKQLVDCRPDINYQIGVMPENSFTHNKSNMAIKNGFTQLNRSLTLNPPTPERYWRYFWRINDDRVKRDSLYLTEQQEPEFEGFAKTLNKAGGVMVESMETVSRMLEIGLGLGNGELTDRITTGNHILSPVGTCLDAYAQRSKALSSFHVDLNYITVHGKCRYPGLAIWLPNGNRIPVFTPPGSMLMQVGSSLEHLTGGYFKAGYHEVICSKELMELYEQRKSTQAEQWRIATVLFTGLDYSSTIEPLGNFKTKEILKQYPRMSAYDFIKQKVNELY